MMAFAVVYIVVCLSVTAYVARIGRRQRQLQRSLEDLEREFQQATRTIAGTSKAA